MQWTAVLRGTDPCSASLADWLACKKKALSVPQCCAIYVQDSWQL